MILLIWSKGFTISPTVSSNKKSINSQVYIPDNKDLFDYFSEHKDQIEKQMGQSLVWDKKDKRKVTKISISHNINPWDRNNWDKIVQLHLEDAEKIYSVFKPLVDEYNSNKL